MARKKKSLTADEPQNVAEVGPTPYEYLFAETAEKVEGFLDDVRANLESKPEEN